MKTNILIVLAALAMIASPAAAKTVKLAGVHNAAQVQSMCKNYGGTFSASRSGHGCAKSGYGKVWCSKSGKCIARLEEGFKLAQK